MAITYPVNLRIDDKPDKGDPDNPEKIRHRVTMSVSRLNSDTGSSVTVNAVHFIDTVDEITAAKADLKAKFAIGIPVAEKRQEKIAGLADAISAWLLSEETE